MEIIPRVLWGVFCNSLVLLDFSFLGFLGKFFITLFAQTEKLNPQDDPETLSETIKTTRIMNKVLHKKTDDMIIPVDIWISLSEYPAVNTSDITLRLKTEAQFNQTAKFATLGEMATGVGMS